ncbi:MAG: hypothetical protein GKS06_00295 [Acidobacteria bacterium]|nr:hypothetical protein [Acidobacteriota bacterium]
MAESEQLRPAEGPPSRRDMSFRTSVALIATLIGLSMIIALMSYRGDQASVGGAFDATEGSQTEAPRRP